jgi:hypothetical protein
VVQQPSGSFEELFMTSDKSNVFNLGAMLSTAASLTSMIRARNATAVESMTHCSDNSFASGDSRRLLRALLQRSQKLAAELSAHAPL